MRSGPQALGRRDSLLVVKDTGGAAFGAFVPFAWRCQHEYYGTGERRARAEPRAKSRIPSRAF